jgi:hypothetical protein
MRFAYCALRLAVEKYIKPKSSNQPRLAFHCFSQAKDLNLPRLSRRKSGLADDRHVLVVLFLLKTRKGF